MLGVALALLVLLSAQDPAPSPEIEKLREHVERAEALVKETKLPDAREATRSAWEIASLLDGERRSNEPVQALLWRLGFAAYKAQDFRVAHDSCEACVRYREKTLPDDHPALQQARTRLAAAKSRLGDLRGASELFEKVVEVVCKTLPEDHADLQQARLNLAATRRLLGDLHGALEIEEEILAVWSKTRSDDDPGLQALRGNLGATKQAIGDLRGALALEEKVLEVRSRTLPDDHPYVQLARQNLAVTKGLLGDLRGALALEDKVFEVRSRTLPDDHPDLQAARQNLANTKAKLGDLHGALVLEEKVFEVRLRTLPADHPYLQNARQNLAGTKSRLGDLGGALALQEKAFEVQSRTLSDDHRDLQVARQNLAISKRDLGDLRGALALEEKVLEVLSRTLPDDHPALQTARGNLGATKDALGDLPGALALKEKVLEVHSRTLHDDHPYLQTARLNLAVTKCALGDLLGALALAELALEVRTRTLPDDHPDLQRARMTLASTKYLLGDLESCVVLEEKALQVYSRTFPADHPDLQTVRGQLAWAHLFLGNGERASELTQEQSAWARRRLADWVFAPRAAGAMARQEGHALDLLVAVVQGFGEIAAQPEVAGDALLTSQALRGASTRAARRSKRARAVDRQQAEQLENQLRAAVVEVSRVVGAPLEGEGEEREAELRARSERLVRVVLEKEKLQAALIALATPEGSRDAALATVVDLAARLPDRSAAAAIVGYTHLSPDPEHPGRGLNEERLAALVLDCEGQVTLLSLAARNDVEERVAILRRQVGADSSRGRRPGRRPGKREDPLQDQRDLRRLVLDPILEASADVDTLFLGVDEALELMPLDALATDDGEPVGTKIAVRPLVSLFDLLQQTTTEMGETPTLITLGGIDYDAAATEALVVVADAAAPPVDTRAGGPERFGALGATEQEVERIVRFFKDVHAAGKVHALSGRNATKAALLEHTSNATFLHVATHGYFAPESVASTADHVETPLALRLDQRITGLSPLVLTGLALSGANLPADDLGRVPGILTAEEILSLDFSNCYLVTLSACDTSLGVRRAGQSYASLRAALLGAGARYVLTSLWKVGDEATMELMVDFYRRLWVEKKDPHDALWEARMAARKRGVPFRDWAGWVMTGL